MRVARIGLFQWYSPGVVTSHHYLCLQLYRETCAEAENFELQKKPWEADETTSECLFV